MPQKFKSKKQLKKEKSAKKANNTPSGQMSGASNQQGMAAKINGSMSRMGNPSKPQYPVIKMKSLKYFRPYSAWNVGPVAGSIVLAEAIGFEINDFISTASLESWEEIKLDRLELFWELQQDDVEVPHTVYSSVDPLIEASEYGSIGFNTVLARQNLQKSQLNMLVPSTCVASFVPNPRVLTDDVPHPGDLYKGCWLSTNRISDLKFNGVRIMDLIISNPYTDPTDRPKGILSAVLHFSVKGKSIDTQAFLGTTEFVGQQTLPPLRK